MLCFNLSYGHATEACSDRRTGTSGEPETLLGVTVYSPLT